MIPLKEYVPLVCCLNLSLGRAHACLTQTIPDIRAALLHLEAAQHEAKKLRRDLADNKHL